MTEGIHSPSAGVESEPHEGGLVTEHRGHREGVVGGPHLDEARGEARGHHPVVGVVAQMVGVAAHLVARDFFAERHIDVGEAAHVGLKRSQKPLMSL